MKLRISFNSLIDILILILTIVVVSFADYRYLSMFVIVVSFIFVSTKYILKKIKLSKLCWIFIMCKISFCIWSFATIFWSINRENSTYYSISLILRLMLSITIVLYIRSGQSKSLFFNFLILSTLILCIRLLIVVPLSEFGVSRIGNYLNHDPDSSYGNTQLTYIFGFVSGLLMFDDKIVKKKALRCFLIIIFVLFSFLSGSKKQFFFIIIALLVFVLYKAKDFTSLIKYFMLFLLTFVIFLILIFNIDILYSSIGSRLESFFAFFIENNESDLSTINRFLFLKEAWLVFASNPLFGIGIDGFRFVNSIENVWAENNFLELLADTGIIGFILYYIPHILLLKIIIKKGNTKILENYQNIILFLTLIFIDLTMVSYRSIILQFFFACVFSAMIIPQENKKIIAI